MHTMITINAGFKGRIMPENIIAPILGGLLSCIRHWEQGRKLAITLSVTGVALSFYLTASVDMYLRSKYQILVEPEAIAFMFACYLPEFLDKGLNALNAYTSVTKWKK